MAKLQDSQGKQMGSNRVKVGSKNYSVGDSLSDGYSLIVKVL